MLIEQAILSIVSAIIGGIIILFSRKWYVLVDKILSYPTSDHNLRNSLEVEAAIKFLKILSVVLFTTLTIPLFIVYGYYVFFLMGDGFVGNGFLYILILLVIFAPPFIFHPSTLTLGYNRVCHHVGKNEIDRNEWESDSKVSE